MEGKPGILRRIFSHAFLILNILVLGWSALCLAASFISPVRVSTLAVFSITTPFALFANVFFILLWPILKKGRRSLFPIVAIAVCGRVFFAAFGCNFFRTNDFSRQPSTIKIMSWNAHGLGVYETDSASQSIKARRITDFIAQEQPDILCIPEYAVNKGDSMRPNTLEIMKRCGYTEFRYNKDNTFGRYVDLGTAIFSKYPLTNFKTYPLDRRTSIIDNETTYLLQADVPIGKRTFRLFAVHLYSFGISERDIDYIEQLKGRKVEHPDTTEYDSDFLGELNRRHISEDDHFSVFLFKLKYAYAKRAREADEVANVISQSPYPVLICGDFNEVPGSYAYFKIKGENSDAFVQKSRWLGRTFNQIIPSLRIDYIFYNPAVMAIKGYKTPPLQLSDHRPVIVNLEMKN